MIFIDFPALGLVCLQLEDELSWVSNHFGIAGPVAWQVCRLDVVAWDVVAGGGMEHQKQDQIFVHFEVLKLFEVRVCWFLYILFHLSPVCIQFIILRIAGARAGTKGMGNDKTNHLQLWGGEGICVARLAFLSFISYSFHRILKFLNVYSNNIFVVVGRWDAQLCPGWRFSTTVSYSSGIKSDRVQQEFSQIAKAENRDS